MRRQGRPIHILLILLFVIGVLHLSGLLTTINEGFGNPFEELIKKFKESQQSTMSYDKWVGYLYKNPEKNSAILNDYKSRVFQPYCKFRDDWATKLPQGKSIPMPAENPQLATIAYKKFFDALSKGEGNTGSQLYDSLNRFMDSDCQILNDPEQYKRQVQVSFK